MVASVAGVYSDGEQRVHADVAVRAVADHQRDRDLAQSWSVFPLSVCQPASVVSDCGHARGGAGGRQLGSEAGWVEERISNVSALLQLLAGVHTVI